jgi:hypothetical protein
VNNTFFRPSDNTSQISHAAHDKPDNPLCLIQLAGGCVPGEQPRGAQAQSEQTPSEQTPSEPPAPPNIKDYPLVREFRTKLEGLNQLSGANLEDELKAYHAGLPPGFTKAVEKERQEYEAANEAYQQRMIDLGLNETPDQRVQVGKPIYMHEPKPGRFLVQNELQEEQIKLHNEVAFEHQAERLRTLMGPGFEREAQSYVAKLRASEPAARPDQSHGPLTDSSSI